VSVSAGVAGILFARRVAGAFQQPLASLNFVVIGAGLTILLGLARWAGLATKSPAGLGLFECLASLTVVLLGISVTLPGSPTWAVAVFWSLVVGGEIYGWLAFVRTARAYRGDIEFARQTVSNSQSRSEASRSPGGDPHGQAASSVATEQIEAPEDLEETGEFSSLPTGVWQRITRARSEDGEAVIEGLVRCEFMVGQRQQNLHVAFCPPLERTPELTAEQVDGPVAAIRATLVEAFGACWEVRLAAPSIAPSSVQIHFFAIERPTAHSAASA
jgi:hypothetical protein